MRKSLALVILGSLATWGGSAAAQTAAEINRLNQAIQICNSPMGAGMAECAKLRGRLGLSAPQGYGQPVPTGGGGATAGILGALNAAMATRAPTPVAAPAPPSVSSQGVAACVRNADGDTTAIQACLATASAPRASVPTLTPNLPPPRPVPALGQPIMPAAPATYPGGVQSLGTGGGGAARGIYQAGQSYQGCVAANPNNWQSCLHLLNGGMAPR